MRNQEINTIENQNEIDWYNIRGEGVYVKDLNAFIQIKASSLRIMKLDDAFLKGKIIPTIFITSKEKHLEALIQIVYNNDYQKLISDAYNIIENNQIGEYNKTYFLDGYEIQISYTKANKVFSPFHLYRIKPIKETPRKWNKTLVIRALINNQFKNLSGSYYCPDDARYDESKISNINPLGLAREILDYNQGYVWNSSKNIVTYSFHSNLSYDFEFIVK